jgi:nicotinate-nucleotide pyrophosphorylase
MMIDGKETKVRVIIEVSGGVVTNVLSNVKPADIDLMDHDELDKAFEDLEAEIEASNYVNYL